MAPVSGNNDELPPDFVQRQREWLESLRDQLLHDTNEAEAEERGLSQRHGTEVQDTGDEGAIEAQRKAADVLNAEKTARLAEIQRALEKLKKAATACPTKAVRR